jgi:hypothetical protein
VAGNVHSTEQIPSFLINSKKLNDPENAAVACNNGFLTLAEILNLHQVGKEDVILFLTEPFPGNFPGLKIIVTIKTQLKL